jgi:hypothetical protein
MTAQSQIWVQEVKNDFEEIFDFLGSKPETLKKWSQKMESNFSGNGPLFLKFDSKKK